MQSSGESKLAARIEQRSCAGRARVAGSLGEREAVLTLARKNALEMFYYR